MMYQVPRDKATLTRQRNQARRIKDVWELRMIFGRAILAELLPGLVRFGQLGIHITRSSTALWATHVSRQPELDR